LLCSLCSLCTLLRDNHWVWWVGPLTGSVVASFAWFVMMHLDMPTGAPSEVIIKDSTTKADDVAADHQQRKVSDAV
jgi:hypothetical protein